MFIAGAPASEKQVTELMVMAPIRSSKMAFWLSALVRTLQLSQPARYVMARMNALGEAGAAVACTVESGNTKPPEVLWIMPTTLSFCPGVVVPTPTLPVAPSMAMRSAPPEKKLAFVNSAPGVNCALDPTMPIAFEPSRNSAPVLIASGETFRLPVASPVPRTPPFTSKLMDWFDGGPCPTPTPVLLCDSNEFPSVPLASVNTGIKLAVITAGTAFLVDLGLPVVVLCAPVLVVLGLASVAASVFAPIVAGTNAYAEAGLPPRLSASASFKAYGTLTSNTRGCSTSPGRFSCTPNQRGSAAPNSSTGRPSLFVAPSSTV